MTPQVQIDLGRAWCAIHALPWKTTWPDAGALVAMLAIFDVKGDAGDGTPFD